MNLFSEAARLCTHSRRTLAHFASGGESSESRWGKTGGGFVQAVFCANKTLKKKQRDEPDIDLSARDLSPRLVRLARICRYLAVPRKPVIVVGSG